MIGAERNVIHEFMDVEKASPACFEEVVGVCGIRNVSGVESFALIFDGNDKIMLMHIDAKEYDFFGVHLVPVFNSVIQGLLSSQPNPVSRVLIETELLSYTIGDRVNQIQNSQ
jgi:hypothetical protein